MRYSLFLISVYPVSVHPLLGVIHGGVHLLKQLLIGTSVLWKISDTDTERDAVCKGKLLLSSLPILTELCENVFQHRVVQMPGTINEKFIPADS